MKNVFLRVSAGGLLLAGGALISPPVLADGQPALHIIRDGKGALIQSIAVADWSWDASRGVLEVASTSGDRVCAGVPKGRGSRLLILDGRAYPLENVSLPKNSSGSITVTPVSKGAFPACVPKATGAAPAAVVAKGELGLSVEFDLISDLAEIEREIDVNGGIRYTPLTRITANVSETLLCLEEPSAAGIALRLTDANGVQEDFAGVAAVTFMPGDRLLDLDFSPGLLCFAPTSTPVNLLPPMLSAADDPLCPGVNNDPTGLPFADGFESVPTQPGQADLKFDTRLVRAPSLDGDSLQYEYIVQNCGLAAIDSVTLRDFFPAANGPSVALDSSWNVCDAEQESCSPVETGTGYVDTVLGRLEPGARVVIRADRALTSGDAGERIRIDAVALVNDGSKAVPDHIAVSHPVTILETGNLAPVMSVVTGTLTTSQAPLEILEDGGEERVDGGSTFRLKVEDTDSGFSCSPGPCGTVISTSRPDVIGASDVRFEYNPTGGDLEGRLNVWVTPKDNAFGEVELTIAARDIEGGNSNGLTFVVDVDAVNDPPSFRLAEGGVFPPDGAKLVQTAKGGVTIVDATDYCDLVQNDPAGGFAFDDPNCVAHRWVAGVQGAAAILQYENWFDGLSSGPGGEVEPVQIEVTWEDPNDIFLLPPDVNLASGQLFYQLTPGKRGGATIFVTATDSLGGETVAAVSVSVANAVPEITAVAEQSVAEDFTGNIVNLDATDSDVEDTIEDWSIVGASPASFADAFAVSMNGVLSVADEGPIDFEALPANAKFVDVTVGASDGIDVGTLTVRINVTDADDEAPVEAPGIDTQVSIVAGEGLNLTASNLQVTDVDSVDATSRYRIAQGNDDVSVRLNGQVLAQGAFFTQADIDSKTVRLVVDADASSGLKFLAFQLEDAAGNVNDEFLAFVVSVTQP